MLDKLQEALMAGKKAEVETLVDQAIAAGFPTRQILNEGLIAGMEKLGILFKNNEVFIPEVLVAARAMNAALARLEPLLIKDKIEPKGVVVIGTVKGDLHDIGKNLVAMMLKGAGYKIVDLGADVPAEKFIDAAKTSGAGVVALSALLTTTMIQMKSVIQAVQGAGLTMPVIVGGAPLTQDYADKIGADGYAPDAASAVDIVRRLLA
jgi:5-methyltetrahydrofolate--homocysteine methyltransferase